MRLNRMRGWIVLSLFAVMPVLAQTGGNTVAERVAEVRQQLEGQGYNIVAEINHAAGAASVGLTLRPTTVVVATHPWLDGLMIRRSQRSALDLPLKYLVYEAADGAIELEYKNIGFELDRHDVRITDPLLRVQQVVRTQFGDLPDGVTEVVSTRSFEGTLEALFAALASRNLRVPVEGGIDFRQVAAGRGMHLRPTTLVLFGNPNIGTPLMQNDQSIGLDLPQKMLVYQSRGGEVILAYNEPAFLAGKHALQNDADPGPVTLDQRLTNISNALAGIASEAAGTP
ncbi:MAG: hypothetical protein Tsb002_15640 [Wenzhouxiangellaceae bacterium]